MKFDGKFYEDLKEKIMPYFDVNDDLHGWSHTLRVCNNANKIMENGIVANKDVIMVSANLHDVARKLEMEGQVDCHAREGAKCSESILGGMGVDKKIIDAVSYSVLVHRVSSHILPETIEAKVLQDADRLDALGAIIVARCFDYGSRKQRHYFVEGVEPKDFYDGSASASTIHHMQEKILRLTPDKFHTSIAREIANGRYKFVEEFVHRFIKEWKGEK